MQPMVILGAVALLTGCMAAEDAGPVVQRDFDASAFDRVMLEGSPDVVVTVGGAPSVRAEGNQALVDRLDIRVEQGELRVGYRRDENWSVRDGEVTVHVTVPSLAGASVTGSGDMRVSALEAQRFAASLTGSGDLSVERLTAQVGEFTLTGSGGLRVTGSTQQATVSVTGSGDADLGGLEAQDAAITLRGSGDAALRATRTARVSLSGSGDAEVTGGARCEIQRSGSGDARCG